MAKPTSWSGSREEFRRWLSGQKATFKEGEKQIHKECRKRPSDKGLERRQTRDEKTCLSWAKKIKFFLHKQKHNQTGPYGTFRDLLGPSLHFISR